jgi:zinc resistance-associated protein
MKSIATLVAGAALAALGTVASAQTPPAGAQSSGAEAPAASDDGGSRRPRLTRAEMESLVDARIAAMQAGLKLNAEQQRLWPAVEQAIRARAAARIARVEQRREAWTARNQTDAARPDFMTRLERRSERVAQRAEAMKALATAMKPLWASLDERQKRLLPVLMRPIGGFGGRRAAWREGRMGRHHRMGGERGPRGQQ